MSFLDRITECNNADLARFRPFRIGAEQAGWVHTDFLPVLRGFPEVFLVSDKDASLAPSLNTPGKRKRALDAVLRQWKREGRLKRPLGELYPVHPIGGGPRLMAMERTAVGFFGVRARGVHMKGFVRKRDGRGSSTTPWPAASRSTLATRKI